MRARRLAILSVFAAVLATGCVTPHYGHGSRYDRGYYGGRYYGRPVVVRPAPVIVRRPVIRYVEPHRRHPKREWVHAHRHDRGPHGKHHDRRDRSDHRKGHRGPDRGRGR